MIHILVVDDEIGVRELLREVLEDAGYRVTTASTAAEAERHLTDNRPDLVLLDYSLPDRDGLSLIRSWAATKKTAPRVIMLSGYATIDSAVEATRLGAEDFLEKPIALQKLLTAVSRALNSRPGGAASAPPPAAQPWSDVSDDALGWPQVAFGLPYREARLEFERAYFLTALAREGGNMSQVADRTGIERTTLYRKFNALGLRAMPAKR